MASKDSAKHALQLIEAALYVSGRPLSLEELSSVTGIKSEKRLRKLVKTLAARYEVDESALEILELEDGRFVMQLKPEYAAKVWRLSAKPMLTSGPLKTLSYIAYKQPITQAEVVEVRGHQAYAHIKQLVEMGLVSWEKLGRTKLLRTTDLFASYFNLSKDPAKMRKQLEALFREAHSSKGRECSAS